jgi:hypothetical protein
MLTIPLKVDSDIVVDFELAYRNSEPKIPSLTFADGVILRPTVEDPAETFHEKVIYDDQRFMRARWSQFAHNTDLLRPRPLETLTKDWYILLPARVYGYVLLRRKWCTFLNLNPQQRQ